MMSRIRESAYFLQYGLVRILFFFVRLVPLPVLGWLSCVLGNTAYFVLIKKRRIALENLQLAFGQEKSPAELRRIARKSLQQLVLVFLELPRLAQKNACYENMCEISTEDRARLQEVSSRGKGAIFLTAHMANWEFLVLLFGKWFSDLSVIGRPINNHYLFDFIRSIRSLTGAHHIDKDQAVRQSVRVLRRGGMLGMLIDQRAGEAGVLAPFFGRPANTTALPALMKKKFDCGLLTVLCFRLKPGRFRVLVPEEIPDVINESDPRDLAMTVAAYNASLEKYVRQYPEQWLWYHRRWRL